MTKILLMLCKVLLWWCQWCKVGFFENWVHGCSDVSPLSV